MRERFRSGVGRSPVRVSMAILVGFGGTSYAAVKLAGADTDGSSISVSELVRPFLEHAQPPAAEGEPNVPEGSAAPPPRPSQNESVRAVVTSSGQVISGGERIYSVSGAMWAGGRVPGVYAFRTDLAPHSVAAELTAPSPSGDITADVRSERTRNGDDRAILHTIIIRTYDRAGRLADRPFTLRIN